MLLPGVFQIVVNLPGMTDGHDPRPARLCEAQGILADDSDRRETYGNGARPVMGVGQQQEAIDRVVPMDDHVFRQPRQRPNPLAVAQRARRVELGPAIINEGFEECERIHILERLVILADEGERDRLGLVTHRVTQHDVPVIDFPACIEQPSAGGGLLSNAPVQIGRAHHLRGFDVRLNRRAETVPRCLAHERHAALEKVTSHRAALWVVSQFAFVPLRRFQTVSTVEYDKLRAFAIASHAECSELTSFRAGFMPKLCKCPIPVTIFTSRTTFVR